MVEIEIGVLRGQCLDRRIPALERQTPAAAIPARISPSGRRPHPDSEQFSFAPRTSSRNGHRVGPLIPCSMTAVSQEDRMKAITELTVAAMAVVFLVAVAFQIDHARAGSPAPLVEKIHIILDE
jgi:hypothetical protein